MKPFIFTTLFLIINTSVIFACCAEKDYRLFPIGEINENIVLIQFDLFRNCKMASNGEQGNQFYTKGTVNLVKIIDDNLSIIQRIDTIDITECISTYKDFYDKTEYETKLTSSYQKALTIAKQKNDFKIARTMNILFNDTINTEVIDHITDSTYILEVKYKNLITIDLGAEDITSCEPDRVAEVRTYKTENFEIVIIRLRCQFLEEKAILNNKKRFKDIETAFWKEQAQWHGIAKDFWIVK